MWHYLLKANRDPDAGIDEAQVEQDAQVRCDNCEINAVETPNIYCDSI